MARALECPACGHRHRLDSIPASDTFRCEQCGQALKAPTAVSSQPDAPPPPARSSAPPARAGAPAPGSSATGASAPVAPPPRRTTAPNDDATRDAQVRTAAAVSATVSATASAPAASAPANGAEPAGRGTPRPAAPPSATRATAAARSKVHWYWRVLAWIVAVPLGFLLTAWPAYKFDFIKKDDLLDIFVGTGIGRYVRLGVVTLVWAVVTALLVQLFVEGGRARANRRRARAAAA